ncbi:MAG: glycosyltransferase family A protein [Proteobacteria bacterium]|nr:glycosyltransferase family A protein [Pseudomonadota bacterium]
MTVVVPAWRARATIGRALASIAAQTVQPAEVIVIDDGSKDGTAKAADDALKALDLGGRVIEAQHGGAGTARNRGLDEAAHPLVAFLDADDEWLPEKIERSLPFFSDPAVVLVAHDGLIAREGAHVTQGVIEAAERHAESRDPFLTLYRKGHIITSSVVARREVLISAGGFDESLPTAQDFDLWLSVLTPSRHRFVVFDGALVRYHVSPGGITAHTARRLACTLKVALRHAPALRGRDGFLFEHVAFRVAAVHREAFLAWRARGQRLKSMYALAIAPFSLAIVGSRLALGLIPGRGAKRIDVRSQGGTNAACPTDRFGRVARLGLSAWVVFAFVLYGRTLVGLFEPIVASLGLK